LGKDNIRIGNRVLTLWIVRNHDLYHTLDQIKSHLRKGGRPTEEEAAMHRNRVSLESMEQILGS